jgi:hypothetical protein
MKEVTNEANRRGRDILGFILILTSLHLYPYTIIQFKEAKYEKK